MGCTCVYAIYAICYTYTAYAMSSGTWYSPWQEQAGVAGDEKLNLYLEAQRYIQLHSCVKPK